MFSRSIRLGRVFLSALAKNRTRLALTALPIIYFAQQAHELRAQESSSNNSETPKIVPHAELNGNITLCHKSDIKEGSLKLIDFKGRKILLANIDGVIFACDGVSPVDNKTLLDSTLLIGDKVFDLVNGAIFSMRDGISEYSPNLEQLKKIQVLINDNGVVAVKGQNEQPAFDIVNMRGWVPEFTNLVILGSGLETLNIARTLRQAKYRGLITIMYGEDVDSPYDKNLLFEDLNNINVPPVRSKEFYDMFQIKISKNKEKVKYVNIDEQIVKTTVGKEDPVPFQRLVYALGTRPRFHGIIGQGLSGIYQPISLADFKQLKKDSAAFKKVVIVGDSINSLKMANNLRKNTKAEITLVTENEGVLSQQKLGEEVHTTLISELKKSGVNVLTANKIRGAFGTGKVEKVVLENGNEVACDTLFLMREEFPNVDSCESSMRLCDDGALYTDSYQRTVSQGIWTVGPTASILNPFIGVRGRYHTAGETLLQAHSTALNLIDKRLALRSIPFETIKLGEVRVNFVGFTETSTNHSVDGDVDSNDYITYYYRGDQLVGAASPNRFKDLAIVREALYQDIVPRGQFEINPQQLLNQIQNLKPSKIQTSFMENMRKRAYIMK